MDIISSSDLAALVPMPDAIAHLRAAYAARDSLGVQCPARTFIRPPDGGALFGAMPVYGAACNKFVVKVASFHPANLARGLPSIHGVVLVLDGADGRIEAMIDAAALTALRTAATSAVVADLLAPAAIDSIALIGTGAQAEAQLNAMLCIRQPAVVRVFSRQRSNVERFIAARQGRDHCRLLACDSVAAAVDGARIICTATTSATPLFARADIRADVHISAIGQHDTETREFPLTLLDEAMLVVEERDAAVREAGAYNRAGVEISELIAMERPAQRARMSIYASVGTAFQDLCVAVLAAARWQAR